MRAESGNPKPPNPPLLLQPGQRVHLVLAGHVLPSWNTVMRLNPGAKHRLTQKTQLVMLSALRAGASAPSTMTTCAKSSLSTACDTLGCYLTTGTNRRGSSRGSGRPGARRRSGLK